MAEGSNGQKRTPKSAKLPQSDIEAAVKVARAVDELAGPSSRPRVAQQIGVSPSGSGFKTDVASAKYLGLVSDAKQKLTLTKRGADALSSDAATAERARQDAILSSNFGQLVLALSGRVAEEGTVSARLQEDHAVPQDSADRLATTLLTSARSAGLVVNERWDASAIETTAERVTPGGSDEPAPQPTPQPTPRPPAPDGGGAGTGPKREPKEEPPPPGEEQPPHPFDQAAPTLNIDVSVKVDLATVPPDEAIEFIKALRDLNWQTPES